jgi:glycine/serine hydroxymethyltransferase
MLLISNFIEKVISSSENEDLLLRTAEEVRQLCSHFPAPGLEHLH